MKAVCLISSGIDSPVAAYLISKYVDELILLHVDNEEFSTGDDSSIFFSLANLINKISSCNIRVGIVTHGDALRLFRNKSELKYTCVFCKRMMIRYANRVALEQNADLIVMGDSLGQVASQTLQNIRIIDSVSTVPIIRPLIGLDKQDIIEIARKIGSYDISVDLNIKCLAVPLKPSTRARDEIIEEIEKDLNISDLINDSVSNIIWKKLQT